MIKLFSAAGNGSPGCPKLLYTHYKMVAGIREKGNGTGRVCLITDPVVLRSSDLSQPHPEQTGKCQNLSSPGAMNA